MFRYVRFPISQERYVVLNWVPTFHRFHPARIRRVAQNRQGRSSIIHDCHEAHSQQPVAQKGASLLTELRLPSILDTSASDLIADFFVPTLSHAVQI